MYFGHGDKDALIVPAGLLRKKVVLADEVNLTGTPDRIVIAVACWSSDGLGKAATDKIHSVPVQSYLGWLDEVSWPEEWPDPIGDAVVEGLSPLFNGQTVADCRRELESRLDDAHDTYRTQGQNHMAPDRVPFGKMCALYWRHRMDVQGDDRASI
ncbi:MAG: hypothetical protein QOF45_1773 [Gaiellaceae bacterium]|jgi:hypothetical protein|nr:hypothetical protein [Gaiellaceae bacterium]